jgi:endoglucanase
LWRTTGEGDYEKYFLAHYGDFKIAGRGARGGQPPAEPALVRATNPQDWGNVTNLGLWTYVLGKGKDAAAVGAIRDASLKAADEIVRRTPLLPYHHSMTTADYIWGSNAVAANYGMQLLVANAFKPNPRYVETALDNLHYLLGRNTFSISWVTQLGANPYKHPHHRPSGADGIDDPWPGMLSGGPNRNRQDSDMTKLLPATYPPARGYVDVQGAYACNEIAINWQAPLVFLLAGALK